jgi:hypothetical protein
VVSSFEYLLYSSRGISTPGIVWAIAMSYAELRVSEYVRLFWMKDVDVPMMREYKDAVADMTASTELFLVLSAGWGAMATIKLFGL